ncbi:sugar porter family MFS transporter [Paraflavitalea pollutisoli]|uniref:sugar porter family MFS transporter n=1 Tax=Paraflavitalea pollutisoli TaxID=3034143 RepID=UPI0023EB0811|nr:sugar porter family MFS transporter [Paraflavitalea sp. H1-2-19X]
MHTGTTRTAFNATYITGICFIAALGGYLFGFDFAVIAGGLPFLQKQFGLDAYWEGFVTGVLALGAILGCLVAGDLSNRFGRKPALLTAACLFGLSSLAMALAPGRDVFIAARGLAGVAVGMASMLSPLYIAELAPPVYRGRLIAINQLTIVLGIFFTNLINYSLRNQGDDAWRWMFGLGVAPAALFFGGLLWLPESPRWLIKKGRTDAAKAILSKIGGAAYAQSTITDVGQPGRSDKKVRYRELLNRLYLPAVLTGIALAVFQQFCGINTVFNYTPLIFKSMGASPDDQLFQTVLIGAVNFLFTVLAILLVDRLGRKPLMLAGAGGLCVLYLLIAWLLQQQSPSVSWLLLSAIGVYALSLAPVTWVLMAEIFPGKVRVQAITVAGMFLWLAYFTLVFTFPVLFETFKENTFYLYAGVCALGFLLVWRAVRETKGKSLEEIDNLPVSH